MSKHDIANRVVAYQCEGGEEAPACGLVIAVARDDIRLFEYVPVADPTEHITAVERELADETAYIASCQEKLSNVERQLSHNHPTASRVTTESRLKEKWLTWAKDALRRLTTADLKALVSGPTIPSGGPVEVVCSAVATLLKAEERSITWSKVREVFADPALVNSICQLEVAATTRKVCENVMSRYYTSPHFGLQEATAHSPALGALHKWLTAYTDLHSARVADGVDLESQQQRDELRKGLTMAQDRRARLEEDIHLSRQGKLFRRTNRIKVVPRSSILKVVGEAPTRLGREFVIKGLDNGNSDEALKIVSRTPRQQVATTLSGRISARGDDGGSSAVAISAGRRLSWKGASTASDSEAGASTARRSDPPTPSAASVTAGVPEARVPPQQPRDRVWRLLHGAAAATSATLTSPRGVVAGPSAPSTTAHTPRDAPSPASKSLPPVPPAPVVEAPDAPSQASLVALRAELVGASGALEEVLRDYTRLQAQHVAVVQATEAMVREAARKEAEWRDACGQRQRELDAAQETVASLRQELAALREQQSQPAATATGAGPSLPAHVDGKAARTSAAPKLSLHSGANGKLNRAIQEALLCSSEYIRGAMASLELSVAFP